MEVPPRKIRRVQKELVPQKIIDITGEDDPDKLTVITILPGKNPYDQIDAEEDTHEYMVGDETKSEIHPDDDAADDLSVITLDSYKDLDSEKVREIWKGMAEVKEKERDYYNQLARHGGRDDTERYLRHSTGYASTGDNTPSMC